MAVPSFILDLRAKVGTAELWFPVGVTGLVVYENGDRARYLDHTFACRWVAGDPAPADDETRDARWWPLAGVPHLSAELRARIAVVLDALDRGDRTTRLTPYAARPA